MTAPVKTISATSLSTATPDEGGCLRKWYYRYVERRPQKETKAKTAGVEAHKGFEIFGKTGDVSALPVALRAVTAALPQHVRPGAWQFELDLSTYDLELEGLKVLGKIDAYTNDACEPEVFDLKTVGDPRSVKSINALTNTIQMGLYGWFGLQHVGSNPDKVRLTHGYLVRGKDYVERSGVVSSEFITKRVDTFRRKVIELKQVATISSADDVPACQTSCNVYGGCDYLSVCSAAPQSKEKDEFMSILKRLKETPNVTTAPVAEATPAPTVTRTEDIKYDILIQADGSLTATPAPTVTRTAESVILINAISSAFRTIALGEVIRQVFAGLPGADPRLVTDDAYGYGRWRAIVESAAREVVLSKYGKLFVCVNPSELEGCFIRGLEQRDDVVIIRGVT